MKVKRKQKGFGLLELMLSLVIVALLLIMATRYYSNTHTSALINQEIQQISAIIAAADQISIAAGNYTAVNNAAVATFVPDSNNSAFGTTMTVASAQSSGGNPGDSFTIEFNTPDAASCAGLASSLAKPTPAKGASASFRGFGACAANAFTYTYYYQTQTVSGS